MTTETTETAADLDARIAALTATIERLNQRWKPYANVGGVLSFDGHPMSLRQSSDGAARFRRRQEIAIEIDKAEAERADAGAERARRSLAVLEAVDLDALNARVAATAQRVPEAESALRAAQAEAYRARLAVQEHGAKLARIRQAIAIQEDTCRRWTNEMRLDQERLDRVGQHPRPIGA